MPRSASSPSGARRRHVGVVRPCIWNGGSGQTGSLDEGDEMTSEGMSYAVAAVTIRGGGEPRRRKELTTGRRR